MLTALRIFSLNVVGLVLISLAGCSATVYRAPDSISLPIEELSVLELQALTPVRVFSIDEVPGTNKAGYLFPDEREYGSSAFGAIRIGLLPGKHILRIVYYEQIPGMNRPNVKYSPNVKTLEFVAEKGRIYTISTKVSMDSWDASIVEVKKVIGQE